MKKIITLCILVSVVACNNPEEKATGKTTTDTSGGYKEDNTLNSMPGPTSPDSASEAGIDKSQVDTIPKSQ